MKKKFIRKLFSMAVVLCLALSIASCGTTTGKSESSSSSKISASDTLVFSVSSDIDNFDPFTNQTLTFIKTLGYNCYESLLHIGEKMEYVMDLAESYENPDSLTYIFKLRSGVKFHNGAALTAEDVKFSFEYTQNAALASWLGTFFSDIDKIDVVDPLTVKISLKKISNTFLDDCTMLKIIKKGTETTLKQTPIGTGAFKFVKWSPNDNIELVKFADYWDAGKVKLSKLIIKPIPDKKIQITNLASGTVNLVEDLPISEIDGIKANTGLQLIQTKSSNSTILFEIGRHNVEAFKDPKVMEALGCAFDKETINKTVFKGLAKVIWSPYPTGAKFYKDIKGNEFNLENAKKILAGTAYATGLEFDLMIATGFTDWEKIAIIYQADLMKIGVKMNIKKVEFSEWLDNYLNRKYDMIVNQYPMAGTDPAVYNNIILAQLEKFQLAGIPDVLDLIKQGASEGDQAKRKGIYEKIQDIVFQYKPVMSVVEVPLLYAATGNIKGISVNPVGHTFFKNAYFE